MYRSVDVAVIGAGHAGLNAIKEIRKVTDSYVLINGGDLGTTCARIGCMPSKVAAHLAEAYQVRDHFDRLGIQGAEHLALDQGAALEHIRDLRDTFVDLVLANTTDEMKDEELIQGYAEIIKPGVIKVGPGRIHAKATVIATGARSCVPAEWQSFGDGILTVENLFEQERLPKSLAVLGLGPIGIEIGQALHRLGVEVTGIEQSKTVSRIKDPVVNQEAIRILKRKFPLWLGEEPTIKRDGDGFRVRCGEREIFVEKLFVTAGRRTNLDRMNIERLGVPLDAHGVPQHDPQTLQIEKLPVYLAGDAAGGIANLQQAADQGRVAGYNAVRELPERFRRKTPMTIVFCEPNIATVGTEGTDINEAATAVSQVRFGPVGRALIMGRNRGLLRLYADKHDGRLLGASMIGPRCEHLAHLIAWAIESGMSVHQALKMPFYHPVIEEALQDAPHALVPKIDQRRKLFSLPKFPLMGRAGRTPSEAA